MDQSAEKLAMSLMFREHLAEIKDWHRKDDDIDSNPKTTKIKGCSRTKTNRN